MTNLPCHCKDNGRETDSLFDLSSYSLPQPVNCVLRFEKRPLCHLPDTMFESSELQEVKEIFLNETDVQNFPRTFTSNLQNLEKLNVEKNKLCELPKNLNNLQILKYLRVSSNNLKNLPDEINTLVNLEYLDASNNAITDIPVSVASLVNLKYFIMCNNVLSKLPNEIGALINVEYFDVSNNVLLSVPNSMANLRNLTFLNLSSNSLADLPDNFDVLKLQTLLLSHNRFKSIPDCIIQSLHHVSVLDLSHNVIMFFDYPPKCVSKLIKLDISNNVFHDIPQWLFGEKCKLLRELNISDNKHMIGVSEPSVYSKSGDKMGVCNSLRILKASNCCFSSSSVEFLYGLKALESLTLGNEIVSSKESKHIGNIIFNFPSKTINTCTNLKYLNMNNVGLADLPEDIGNLLAKLESLDMSFNQLMNIPDSFCKLVTLTNLQISSNEVRSLPSDFGMLATLEELRLDGNKLQYLPDSFKKLKKLRILDLYDNIFAELPVTLLHLTNLEACDIDFNLFNIDSFSNEEYRNFITKYKSLKDNMRSLIAGKDPTISREDNKKTDSSEDIISERGDNDAYDLEDVSSDEFEEQEEREAPIFEEYGNKKECVENWDASDDSDSHFDPHLVRKIQKPASYGPSLLVYDALSTSPERFCPADNHSEPIKRGRKLYDFRGVADGQFDDADL